MKRADFSIAVLAIALYAPTWGHFFVSDDFLNLERSTFRTLAEGLALFSTRDVDFYRPLARLHFGVMAGFFADRVIAWNVVSTLLHALVSIAALQLARDLVGRERDRVAVVAGVLFAVHYLHVEPVVWASGVATLLSTFGVLVALLFFRRARRTGRSRDRAISVVALGGALMSQETAVVFASLAIVTTLVWPVPSAPGVARPRPFHEVAPYGIVFAAYALVATSLDRGGSASPYRFEAGPHVLKNLAFFAFGGFVPVRYWQVQDLWSSGGSSDLAHFAQQMLARPDLSLPLAAAAIGLAFGWRRGDRTARGGFAWIGAAALPFLLLPGSGERFHYLPSLGACLALGSWITAAEDRLRARGRTRIARIALGVVAAVSVGAALDRERDWHVAARCTRSLVNRWSYFRLFDPRYPVEFVGVPDARRSAWVFRNGFPSMVRLYWEGRPYWREEERPLGAPVAYRVRTSFGEGGALAVAPVRGEGRGAERPPLLANPPP